MNTLPAHVRPANPAHAQSQPTIVPDWTADRRVRRLLASFRTAPPQMIDLPRHEAWGMQTAACTGFRVACLRVLRNAILLPALRAAWAANDTDALALIADAVSVDDAVAAATRIPTLRLVTTTARQLARAAWGEAA